MKPEIKLLWVEALRSGKYTQGRGGLRTSATATTPEKFCCLGVLCDIHSKQTNTSWVTYPEHARQYYLSKNGVTPYEVMKWAGFTSSDPALTINDHSAQASQHNDSYAYGGPKSFIEIANAIETEL